jgi:hypothetical protein
MSEEEDWLFGSGFGFGAEAGFEEIAKLPLAMQFDSPTQSCGLGCGNGDAGVDCGFDVGG